MRGDQRKKRSIIIHVFLAAFALCLIAPPAFALFGGKVKSFSADNVEIAPDGKVINTSKIYMTPDAMRMDGMPGGGAQGMPKMNLSLLVLKKQDKQYIYNHDKKLVFESPVDEEIAQSGFESMDNIESEKVLGREKVSGYKCVKKEVVTRMTLMGQTIRDTLIVWENEKFDFPLRTRDEEGAVQEMRNIKTGKPSKKWFRPLPGYQKVDNMMAVMGIDFGAMMAREQTMGKKKKDARPNPASKNRNVNEMMEQMSQAMGENMTPEDKAQMMQIMGQAMAQVNQANVGQGASKDLWKIISKRGGDKVGYEMKINNTLDVILGTNSTLQQVFDFYGKNLSSKGWKNQSTYIEDGQGMMSLQKGKETIMFAWAQRPRDMQGNFNIFYNVHYTNH